MGIRKNQPILVYFTEEIILNEEDFLAASQPYSQLVSGPSSFPESVSQSFRE
jgi:hypothetical protein